VGSVFSVSSLSHPLAKNLPIRPERIKWKSDIPLTGELPVCVTTRGRPLPEIDGKVELSKKKVELSKKSRVI
jgi:hypothetical protein